MLRALLGQLWPHYSGAAAGLVGDQLSPQLAINKPEGIGNIPPAQLQSASRVTQYLPCGNPGEMWPHVSGAASGLVGDQLSPQSPAQSPAIHKPKWISNTTPPLYSLTCKMSLSISWESRSDRKAGTSSLAHHNVDHRG
ncbi:TPA: hypothetical protein ACH3X3_003213 [Trebouxia sp. C0006]